MIYGNWKMNLEEINAQKKSIVVDTMIRLGKATVNDIHWDIFYKKSLRLSAQFIDKVLRELESKGIVKKKDRYWVTYDYFKDLENRVEMLEKRVLAFEKMIKITKGDKQ